MINKLDHCPHCDSENFCEILYQDDVRFRGNTLRVDGLRTYSCPDCCEEVMTSTQFNSNTAQIARAKADQVQAERRDLGLLQAEEVRKIRDLLGITQRTAARIFGGGINAFSKYERGEGKQSEAMDRLLRLVAAIPAAASWLVDRYAAGERLNSVFENHADEALAKTYPMHNSFSRGGLDWEEYVHGFAPSRNQFHDVLGDSGQFVHAIQLATGMHPHGGHDDAGNRRVQVVCEQAISGSNEWCEYGPIYGRQAAA